MSWENLHEGILEEFVTSAVHAQEVPPLGFRVLESSAAHRERSRQYRDANKEKVRAYFQAYREKNRERLRDEQRARRAA